MSLIAKVAISDGEDSYAVGANAAQDAISQLGATPHLIMVAASIKYDQEKMLAGIKSVSKDAIIVGASTAGEITTDGPAKKHSVAVLALSSDSIRLASGFAEHMKEAPREAGVSLARSVKGSLGDDPKLFIMFPDGLSGNGSEVVRGVLSVLGEHFPLVGGSAGDDARYKQTFQYHGTSVLSNAVSGVGLAGNFKYSIGVKHGWVPISVPMQVTKSDGAVLYELDNKPAISIYQNYFGEAEAKDLEEKVLSGTALSYPLGLKTENSDEMLLRAPFVMNKDGSIVCGGEVPQGAEVRLMVGNKEEAVEAARSAATQAKNDLQGTPKAVVIFSCHVRNKLFAEDSKKEIDAIQDVIGKDVPLFGFYTYAEEAPLAGETRQIEACQSELHNETVVILLLGE